jgi:hypothetical protein
MSIVVSKGTEFPTARIDVDSRQPDECRQGYLTNRSQMYSSGKVIATEKGIQGWRSYRITLRGVFGSNLDLLT